MDPFSDHDAEVVRKRFAKARSEYEVRKAAAEATVCEWAWFTGPPKDRRPLYFTWIGHKPGRRLKSEPRSKNGKSLVGFDGAGEMVVERSYLSMDRCYEIFTMPFGDLVEVTNFDYYDQHLMMVGHFKYDGDGPLARYTSYSPELAMCELYEWSGSQLQRIDVWTRQRDHVKLAGIHRFIWSPAGKLVETTYSKPDGSFVERRTIAEPPEPPSDIDFPDYLYRRAVAALRQVPEAERDDVYVVSFFVYDEEDDPSRPTLTVGTNTESQVRRACEGGVPIGGHPSDEDEARWNYAFWLHNRLATIGSTDLDPSGAALRHHWRQSHRNVTTAFVRLCVDTARRLNDDGVVPEVFGRSIPVVVHELEYYGSIAEQTAAANPPGLADDFVRWARSM